MNVNVSSLLLAVLVTAGSGVAKSRQPDRQDGGPHRMLRPNVADRNRVQTTPIVWIQWTPAEPKSWGIAVGESGTGIGRPRTRLAIWPDGRIVWSSLNKDGTADYYEQRIDAVDVRALLDRVEEGGGFSRPEINGGIWITHQPTVDIRIGRGESRLWMRSTGNGPPARIGELPLVPEFGDGCTFAPEEWQAHVYAWHLVEYQAMSLIPPDGVAIPDPQIEETKETRIEDSLCLLGAGRLLPAAFVSKHGRLALPFLLEAAGYANPRMRRSAAVALGVLGNRIALPALLALIGDSSDDVRQAAKEAVATLLNRSPGARTDVGTGRVLMRR
ncbi:MAG: HEAT repeat domain-containing protein [Armatimonadetes bacterium]|nr:HEAT repeat domain-containing protein [Armatimonadota bacterium]